MNLFRRTGRVSRNVQKELNIQGGGKYTVQSGDSYFSIAGDIYGDQSFFEQLQLYNPGIKSLRAGMTIKLPRFAGNRRPSVSYRAASEAGLDTSAAFSNLPGAGGSGVTPTPYTSPVASSSSTPQGASTNDFDLKRILAGNLAPQPLGMPRVNYQAPSASPIEGVNLRPNSAGFNGVGMGTQLSSRSGGTPGLYVGGTRQAPQERPLPPFGPGYSNQPQVFTPQQAESARLTLEAAFGGTPATVEGLRYTPQFPPFISNQVIQTLGDPNITNILTGVGYQQTSGGYQLSKEAQAILGTGGSSGGYTGDGSDLGPYAEKMREVRVSRGQRGSGGNYNYLTNGASNFYGGIGGVINWRIGLG